MVQATIRWKAILVGALACSLTLAVNAADNASEQARIARILRTTPLIDGHNDLPMLIRERLNNDLAAIDLMRDTSKLPAPAGKPPLFTDLPRLRAGQIGGQFWSVFVEAALPGPVAVQQTLEQIDIVRRIVASHSTELGMAYSATDIRRLHREGRIASLLGVEGGHQINNSLGVLRQYYSLGVRYMTLTHSRHTDWADSASDAPRHHGLTPFGREVIREMNRLGMMVDLSHVSPDVMRQATEMSVAPVIYSHSSVRALVDNPRNVPDDMIRLLSANGGIIMVNFVDHFVNTDCMVWEADRLAQRARANYPPYGGLYVGQPERAAKALAEWDAAHPRPKATIADVADHIEHIRDVAGIDHVGIGADFEGMDAAPVGLEGVDRYPALLAELMRRGWSDKDIAKVAGENILRVMTAVEAVSAKLSREAPSGATLESANLPSK